ncbi:hypothetical protein D3C76_1874210 [compost metagenome]
MQLRSTVYPNSGITPKEIALRKRKAISLTAGSRFIKSRIGASDKKPASRTSSDMSSDSHIPWVTW